MVAEVNFLGQEPAYKYGSKLDSEVISNGESIFSNIPETPDIDVSELEAQLQSVQDEQGFFMEKWDDLKGAIGVGASSEKCDSVINKYKAGQITFEEASAEIEKYKNKQEGSLDLFSNIATGVAAIVGATAAGAAIVASGGTATPLVLAAVGAGTGAVTKASVKLTDRATNNVDGDAMNGKQIAKDALSGAVTGGIGAATMGTGSAASSLGSSVAKSAARSAKTGIITGAVSGSSNYLIDTAFEEDKKFNAKDFVVATGTNAAVGSLVGGIMGSANGAMRYSGVIKHGGMVKTVTDTAGNAHVANATLQDTAANALCNAEYKLVNKGVRSVAA